MKTLTDWFDRIFVINCKHRPDRLDRVRKHISETGIADMNEVIICPAIIGDWVSAPAGWGAGYGAWGCLRSHSRIAEDVMHERDEHGNMKLQNYLVLEDDVFFLPDAMQRLNEFMNAVPNDWDQIYLGGQHQRKPVQLNDNVSVGISVNRTHAYAVNQKCFQKFYRHINFAPDYVGTNKHIDHQLELAHQRRDWDVYCPPKWICGQEAGSSNISGRINERQTFN